MVVPDGGLDDKPRLVWLRHSTAPPSAGQWRVGCALLPRRLAGAKRWPAAGDGRIYPVALCALADADADGDEEADARGVECTLGELYDFHEYFDTIYPRLASDRKRHAAQFALATLEHCGWQVETRVQIDGVAATVDGRHMAAAFLVKKGAGECIPPAFVPPQWAELLASDFGADYLCAYPKRLGGARAGGASTSSSLTTVTGDSREPVPTERASPPADIDVELTPSLSGPSSVSTAEPPAQSADGGDLMRRSGERGGEHGRHVLEVSSASSRCEIARHSSGGGGGRRDRGEAAVHGPDLWQRLAADAVPKRQAGPAAVAIPAIPPRLGAGHHRRRRFSAVPSGRHNDADERQRAAERAGDQNDSDGGPVAKRRAAHVSRLRIESSADESDGPAGSPQRPVAATECDGRLGRVYWIRRAADSETWWPAALCSVDCVMLADDSVHTAYVYLIAWREGAKQRVRTDIVSSAAPRFAYVSAFGGIAQQQRHVIRSAHNNLAKAIKYFTLELLAHCSEQSVVSVRQSVCTLEDCRRDNAEMLKAASDIVAQCIAHNGVQGLAQHWLDGHLHSAKAQHQLRRARDGGDADTAAWREERVRADGAPVVRAEKEMVIDSDGELVPSASALSPKRVPAARRSASYSRYCMRVEQHERRTGVPYARRARRRATDHPTDYALWRRRVAKRRIRGALGSEHMQLLKVPLDRGWKRTLVVGGAAPSVFYEPPPQLRTGAKAAKLRSRPAVERFLNEHGGHAACAGLSADHFHFTAVAIDHANQGKRSVAKTSMRSALRL